MWTSLAGDSYCSLTTSFINKDFEMHRWVPFVKPFPAKHSGINIAPWLDKMIESLKLNGQKIKLWSVNDNSSNMKVAIKKSKYLTELNCIIHKLQLAVKETFEKCHGMNAVLSKSKYLAQFVRKSSIRMTELKKAVQCANLKFRKPKNLG